MNRKIRSFGFPKDLYIEFEKLVKSEHKMVTEKLTELMHNYVKEKSVEKFKEMCETLIRVYGIARGYLDLRDGEQGCIDGLNREFYIDGDNYKGLKKEHEILNKYLKELKSCEKFKIHTENDV